MAGSAKYKHSMTVCMSDGQLSAFKRDRSGLKDVCQALIGVDFSLTGDDKC